MFYTLGLQTGGFMNPLSAAQGAVGAFRGSMTSLMAKAALVAGPLLGVAGAAGLLKKAISSAADMESTSVAFKTLVGDANLAKKTLNELKALGAATPFEFPELADAGRKLIAFGESAGTVTQALTRIGDVASGVQAPIGEIAEIYGKARVQGQLFAEDINQLTGRGIPVISQFAKILGVTESEVKGLASEGKITFPLLEQAFINLTSKGGQFFNMMQEQSGTINGLWSTLQDNIGEIFRIIGQPINDAIRPMLKDGIAMAGRLGEGMAAFIDLMSAARSQGNFGELIGTSLVLGGKSLVNVLLSGAQSVTAYLGTALPIAALIFRNEITSPRIQAFFEAIFSGVANLLRSELEAGAATFLDGLGPAFEKKASDVRDASAQSGQRAGIYFGAARANMNTADIGGELNALVQQLRYADFKGNEAATKAKGTPFFDLTEDKQKFRDLGNAANPEALKRFTDAINGTAVKKAGEEGATKIKTSADGLAKALADAKSNLQKPVAKTGGAEDGEGEGRRRIRLKDSEESWRARMNRRSAADSKRLPESSMDDAEHEAWKRRQAQKRRSTPLKKQIDGINNAGNQAVAGANRPPAADGRNPLLDPLEKIHAALMGIDGRLTLLEAV